MERSIELLLVGLEVVDRYAPTLEALDKQTIGESNEEDA